MISSALKRNLELSASKQFDLVARWIPKEADALSREPDGTEWGISDDLLGKIVAEFRVIIKLDLFASCAHHVCSKFVSQFYTPGCCAVHALELDWAQLVNPEEEGVTWVFPPIKCASAVLSLLLQFKIECLICIMVKEGSLESIQLKSSKENGAIISEGRAIPQGSASCLPSLRIPS
jgi:hypothetical protein